MPTSPSSVRLALTRQQAAESLGMSLSHFQRYVQPHVPCIYSGQLRLFKVVDLERWLEQQQAQQAS
jgi:hypothetical protein